MSFAAARALQNLGSFIFRDHSLELHEQFVLRRRTARRAHKQGLDAGPGEFLDQENLVRVSSAQPVGRIDEDGLDQPLGSKIAHPLKAGTNQVRPTIAVVLEDPFLWHFELLRAGERDQRRRLDGDRNRVLGRQWWRTRSRQFEVAIGLSSRQAKRARQSHGGLRHADLVREQAPRRSQSFGLLHSRRTNHLTRAYYLLRLKSTTHCPRQPTIARSKRKLSFAFREPQARCLPTST